MTEPACTNFGWRQIESQSTSGPMSAANMVCSFFM